MSDASYCTRCGEGLTSDSQVCPACGTPAPGASAPLPPPPAAAQPVPSPPVESAPLPPPPAAAAAAAQPVPSPPVESAPLPPPPAGAPPPPAASATATASPPRPLIIGLAVLAGVLFLVGILGFALGGGGDSGTIDRLERKEAQLKSELSDTRDGTTFARSITSDLDSAVSDFQDADGVVHQTFGAFFDAISDPNIPFDDPRIAQTQQAYATAVTADQAALDKLRAALARALEAVK